MMVNMMRSNQRWLMIVVTVLACVSLFWFYADRTQVDRMVSDRAGSLYGQSVAASDFSRLERRIQLSQALGLYDLANTLAGGSYDQQEAPINYLVLEHEAEKFGIRPSDEEIRAAGEQLPAFQGPNGGYDPQRAAEFVDTQLNYRGLGANQIDELVKMNLIITRLRAIVTSTAVVSPQEVRTRYEEGYAATAASVIRLKAADYAAVPEPTSDEIQKYFNDEKDQFKQPERRKVQYVKFALHAAQKKLPRREPTAALKPLADEAAQMLETVLDQKGKTDFAGIAAADKLAIAETPEFEENQTSGYPEAAISGFAEAAFRLTPANPDSDVPLETPDAFYDLHLSGVTPERPLTLEEARPKIVTAIRADRAGAALTARAEEIRTKIADAMKAGKSFADATKEAGQTAEDVPPFSLAELNRNTPQLTEIAPVAAGLATGELSKFTPGKDGGFFVYVRGRAPVEESKFQSAETSFTAQLERYKTQMYFFDWLRASRESARPQFNLRTQS